MVLKKEYVILQNMDVETLDKLHNNGIKIGVYPVFEKTTYYVAFFVKRGEKTSHYLMNGNSRAKFGSFTDALNILCTKLLEKIE